tara:strand:+ start:599 stop:1957 length:1359 start_codon:yes stop_codon:yes gene_type:complete
MKILFYVEPHSLRDQFTSHMLPFGYFCWIAKEINTSANAAFDDVEARIFTNHFVADAKFVDNYDHWPMVIQPTLAEQNMIEDTARIWMGDGIDDWVSLMTDPGSAPVRNYVDILKRIKREVYDYDVIVLWGENAAVREVAREEGLQTAFFELASMRAPFPKSVLIDPVGVNGAASTAIMNINAMRATVSGLPVDLIPTFINEEFAKGRQNTRIPNAAFAPLSSDTRAFFEKEGLKALVPLQLADDANQLIYSDYNSVHSFAEAAIEPLLKAGFRVLLKPHPSAKQRGGYVMRQQKRCLEHYGDNENILVLSEEAGNEDYLSMLKAMDLVVTNNSSAGFEAMMMGTRVVVLGRASYAPKGAFPTLDEAIRSFSNTALQKRFDENYSTAITYMLACAFPLERSLGRELVERLKIWRKYEDINAFEWLPEMFNTVGWSTWHQKDFLKQITKIVGP